MFVHVYNVCMRACRHYLGDRLYFVLPFFGFLLCFLVVLRFTVGKQARSSSTPWVCSYLAGVYHMGCPTPFYYSALQE